MRFGVNIINYGSGTDESTLLAWARYAEQRSYDFAMISDHLAITQDVAEYYPGPFYDPFNSLAWLAGRTERIELGTTVTIVPYRHPLHTARLAANVDRFSGGRFILGIGVSWPPQEYSALGLPFHRRGAMTDEYMDIITRAWNQETLSYDGKFVSFEDVETGPLPYRRPPVWVGGSSAAALRRTAQFGDAWHPVGAGMKWIREQGLPLLRETAEKAGRPEPAFAPRIKVLITDTPVDGDDRMAGHGTPDQVRRDLDELAELGATHVLLDTYRGTPDQLRPVEEDLQLLDDLMKHVDAG